MKTRKMLIILGAGILLSGVFFGCGTTSGNPIINAAGANANGTATGFATGWAGEVSVTLTVVDGFITAVEATANHDTAMFAGPVLNRAHNDMIENNTAAIDVVSGATVTSNAVNEAARNALEQILAGQ